MESEYPLSSENKAKDGDDDDQQQGARNNNKNQIIIVSTTPKSYECNFCKRGFSNAQALGGHMNIHRKDKAKKLKQQQSSSLEIVLHDHDQARAAHVRKLPLFEESPSSNNNNNITIEEKEKQQGDDDDQIHHHDDEEEIIEGNLLDLELRLGPQDSSSSTVMGIRKFF